MINSINTKTNHKEEIRWISIYVKKYWKAIFIYALIGVFSTLLSLTGSLLSKKLIDIVTGHEAGKIIEVSVFMIGFGCFGIIFNAISKKVSAYFNVIIQNEVQLDVYNKVIEADWEALNDYRSGDLLNRINGDVTAVSGSVIGWIPNLLIRGVQFVGSLAIIIYYDFTMAIIALISVPISSIVSRFLLRKMRKYNERLRESSSEVMSFQEDSFQNIQSIKAFGAIEYFETKMFNIQSNYKDVALKFNTFSVLVTSFMSFVAMFVSYACLGWGVYRLWSGAIAFGTLTLFLQLAANLNSSFSALIGLVPQAISALTGARRIMDIFFMPDEQGVALKHESILKRNKNFRIVFNNVSFNYKNRTNTLENISFEAHSGEMIGIVGTTGEGKTTLIRLLLGLIAPNNGTITIIAGSDEFLLSAATRDLFSYVPQENTLFAGTIEDNLILGDDDKSEAQIIEALKSACAWEFVSNLPNGIKSEVKEMGKGFSHGQAQRIAIARALLKNAPIILLDEATSALDIKTEQQILKNISDYNKNKMCFTVTHRASVYDMCDRILKIENKNLYEI